MLTRVLYRTIRMECGLEKWQFNIMKYHSLKFSFSGKYGKEMPRVKKGRTFVHQLIDSLK